MSKELLRFGQILDDRPIRDCAADTVGDVDGGVAAAPYGTGMVQTSGCCKANAAQRRFEARQRGQNNIVLKARQMGMTTWIAGRFFLKTVTSGMAC